MYIFSFKNRVYITANRYAISYFRRVFFYSFDAFSLSTQVAFYVICRHLENPSRTSASTYNKPRTDPTEYTDLREG